ncbi:hypothetical protein [Actinomadura violacea]|uniref:Uncharacterized protein n=1 Tax=Actinomadura violacea TaxID=2819934 RepID=A0ABS3RVA0_9ACTN|nr:hypothetical protein [Actinomadura violacea]MBO2460648.1 hypothetical protein [Actinomadura violacea]
MPRDALPLPPSRYRSPAGWQPPSGTMPGWNWGPPDGMEARPDLAPWWVRVLYRTPFVDRYAHVAMWHRGAWIVMPRDLYDSTGDAPPPPPDPSGVREPRTPEPSSDHGLQARAVRPF